jgi:hypothetical protein
MQVAPSDTPHLRVPVRFRTGWRSMPRRFNQLVKVPVSWANPLAAPAILEPTLAPCNLTRTRGRETFGACS